MKTSIKSNSRHISHVALLVFILTSQMVLATNYVTLNNGHMLVFPDSCVENASTDNGFLSFTALDGTVYSYPLEEVSSVSAVPTKDLPSMTAFAFKSKYNYQVYTTANGVIDGKEINVEVAGIGKWLTASFTLSDETALVFVDGIKQVNNKSRMRFDTTLVYTVAYPGDVMLMPQPNGDYTLVPYGRQYNVNVDFLTDQSTDVPRIDINTKDGVDITSKKYYVDAEIIIDGAGVFPSMTDSVQIKGRGNSSWTGLPYAKNPYRLKFAEKVKPFGLTKGKNWVLLANKIKGSMLTNAIGMKAASLIGTEAANHIVPVNLYINGTYKGHYNFTEKVGFANNSVDLDDESAAALLELDTYYDEIIGQKFKSTPYTLPVNIKEPEFSEGTTVLTLDDIKQRFNSFVSAVAYDGVITDHADLDHLARYLLFNDYICNLELYHPKSTFCYYENVLDENSKLKFGPAWDLDWAFGYDGAHSLSYFKNNLNRDYFHALSSNCFGPLGNNSQVASYMYLVFCDFMANGLDELCDFCREYYEYAKPSIVKNKKAGLDALDYDAQIDKAIDWLRGRADYIFEQLKLKYEKPGDVNNDGEVNIGDINALSDIILGGRADADTRRRADVNGDGEVTLGDMNMLVDLIIGK